MRFISYSQNFEDVMLWRALKDVESGFYIDVGANDPTVDSVTRAFYDSGWSGINIEPLKSHYDDLVASRSRDINLCVAAGDSTGEVDLWDCGVRGWGTADQSVIDKHTAMGYSGIKYTVPLRTLESICTEYPRENIHFLKIDVEGFEKTVLAGMDFAKFRPWIVVIEATLPNSKDESFLGWEPMLLGASYDFVYSDGLNRYYLSREHSQLSVAFSYPPCVFDEFVLNSQVLVEQALEESLVRNESLLKLLRDTEDREQVLTVAYDELTTAHSKIINSRFWRLTYPLRFCLHYINKFRASDKEL